MSNECFIGVDVGGTWIRVALVDSGLTVLEKAVTPTADILDVADFTDKLAALVLTVDPKKMAKKVAVITPTPWKNGMTHFRDATNVPFLEGVEVSLIAEALPEYVVIFENDVNVVALIESMTDARRGCESLLYITVSTGIGSGIVINNQIWQGAFGYAGEVGNMIVSQRDRDLVLVLEDVCSGLALDVAAKSLYGEDATTKTLFDAYERHDKWALDTMEGWLEIFSDALASLMHVINPEVIVLGGSVIENNPWLIEALRHWTRPKLFENLRPHLVIEPSSYGSDSGVLGGAALCLMYEEF